jgi:hypothetical protein
MISETVSKKRGRPKAISDDELMTARYVFPGTATIRGLQNAAYAQRAMNGLWGTWEEYSHFLPPKQQVENGEKKLPWTILQGIGRLDREEMLVAAKFINDKKLTTKEAIKFLKSYRLGDYSQKPFNQFELINILKKAIDCYCESHHCEVSQIVTTLLSLLEIVSDNDDENGGAS